MDVNTERTELTKEAGNGEKAAVATPENVETKVSEVEKKSSEDVVPTVAQENDESKDEKTESGEEEQSMAELMAEQDNLATIKRGSIIKGTIIKIQNDEIYVDINHKSEGILSINEFNKELEPVEEGMEIQVMIVKTEDQNGNVVLSKSKAQQKVAWDGIINAHKNNETIKAKIIKKVKGGLEAYYHGLICFVPGSQISNKKEYNLDKYIGEELEFRVMEFNKRRSNIVLSRRQLIAEVEEVKMKEIFSKIEVGQKVVGTVKSITDYGVFVDIGGIDGLLHITDMSWGHITDPKEMVEVGAEIETVILSMDEEKHKISLGLKQLTPDPWESIDEYFEVGMVYQGVVKNTTDFGAFVTLTDGIDGLVHTSDLSWTKKNPRVLDYVTVGEPINVAVLEIDKENRRISLGLRQVTSNPWDSIEETYSVGKIVEGKVKNLTQFGAFVELEDGIEGLVHISDLSWTKRVGHPNEILKEGETVKVKILGVDKANKKISLGIKQTQENPWDSIEEKIAIGSTVEGKVVNIKKFGAFVELEEGIEGLIHVNDISWTDRVNDPNDYLKEGDIVKVKVLGINQADKKLSLGLKQLQENPWEKLKDTYSVGSVIKGKITHFTKFGAFVEVSPGIEGLLHTSDISWTKKIGDPSKVLNSDEEIELKVLQVDVENKKISLGLKQLTEDPYEVLYKKMKKGEIITGKVKSVKDFGAFVSVDEDIEGLVHISQLSDDRVENIDEFIKVDDEVQVKIMEVDLENRKIKLTMKTSSIENNIEEIQNEVSGGEEAGNLSLAEAFGEKLSKLNFDKKDEE